MDARRQKHRMIRWLGRLFVVLSLVTPCGAQAAVESVPPVSSNWSSGATIAISCPNYDHSSLQAEINKFVSCWCPDFHGYACTYVTSNVTVFDVLDLSTPYYATRLSLFQALLPESQLPGSFNFVAMVTFFAAWNYGIPPAYPHDYIFLGTAVCPRPAVTPSVRYSYNVATGKCERNVTLTITLSGGTEVEPSNGSDKKFLPIIATVKDQNDQPPTTPVTVRISLKVDSKSGGHDHGDSTRPRGGIAEVKTCPSDDVCWTSPQPTDGNGQVVFNFNAPEASGTHIISATCEGCSNTATKPVDVKVSGLWPVFDSTYYAFIGSTTKHVSNHYVTSEAQMQLWRLAQAFYEYQLQNGITNPTLLHINDASLKWGGIFDIDADWVPDHFEHRRGSVVDIRANSNPGAIPAGLTDAYIDIAIRFGIDPHLEYDGDPILRHFHTRLLNRKE